MAKKWVCKVVDRIVSWYGSEDSLYDDLCEVAEAYGTESVDGLVKAFVIDWSRDAVVESILAGVGKSVVTERDVRELIQELEKGFHRRGIRFSQLVEKVGRG